MELDLYAIADNTDQAGASTDGVMQTVLIVVAVVLGTLVVVLFAAFFIRTRRWVLQSARHIHCSCGCPVTYV